MSGLSVLVGGTLDGKELSTPPRRPTRLGPGAWYITAPPAATGAGPESYRDTGEYDDHGRRMWRYEPEPVAA